jgi:hypothetical protein
MVYLSVDWNLWGFFFALGLFYHFKGEFARGNDGNKGFLHLAA